MCRAVLSCHSSLMRSLLCQPCQDLDQASTIILPDFTPDQVDQMIQVGTTVSSIIATMNAQFLYGQLPELGGQGELFACLGLSSYPLARQEQGQDGGVVEELQELPVTDWQGQVEGEQVSTSYASYCRNPALNTS